MCGSLLFLFFVGMNSKKERTKARRKEQSSLVYAADRSFFGLRLARRSTPSPSSSFTRTAQPFGVIGHQTPPPRHATPILSLYTRPSHFLLSLFMKIVVLVLLVVPLLPHARLEVRALLADVVEAEAVEARLHLLWWWGLLLL